MKVLMVTPFYSPVIGGTERFIEDISLKLNQIGILTDILTFNFDQKMKIIQKLDVLNTNGLRVIKIPALNMRKIMRVFNSTFIPKKLKTSYIKNYDIIHFHNETDLSLPLFMYPIQKHKIFHFHCLNVTHSFFKKNLVTRILLKNMAHKCIVLSKYMASLLIDLGIPETNIRILPNGIDVQKFSPCETPKIENLLLFVGRIAPQKGLTTLLESLTFLRTSVKLVIIGPPQSHYYKCYFERVIEIIRNINRNTSHEVKYLGVLDLDEVIRWYRAASIFVCPSIDEPFGIVNLEALACKTPVVASNSGGIPEVIRDGINGLLVPPNNPLKLAESLHYLLDNDKIRRNIGNNGRKYVVDNFSSDLIATKLLKVYHEILCTR